MKNILKIDGMTLVLIVILMGDVHHCVRNPILQQIGYLVCAGLMLIVIVDIIRGANKKRQLEKVISVNNSTIHNIYLLNEYMVPIKQWDLSTKNGFLIGNGTGGMVTDIDLNNTEYGALVKEEEAVLNYVHGAWYIENLDTENCINIQKGRNGEKFSLENGQPLKLDIGDILSIAKTRLEVL